MDGQTRLKLIPFLTHENAQYRKLARFLLSERKEELIIEGDLMYNRSYRAHNFPLPEVLDLGNKCTVKGSFHIENNANLKKILCKNLTVEGGVIIEGCAQLDAFICSDLLLRKKSSLKSRWDPLTTLQISRCPKLKKLPTQIDAEIIQISSLAIKILPHLINLKSLMVGSCHSLVDLNFKKLKADYVIIRDCISIQYLPELNVSELILTKCPNLREISKKTKVEYLTIAGKTLMNHIPGSIQLQAESLDIPENLRLELAKKPKKGVYKNMQKTRIKPKCVKRPGRRF